MNSQMNRSHDLECDQSPRSGGIRSEGESSHPQEKSSVLKKVKAGAKKLRNSFKLHASGHNYHNHDSVQHVQDGRDVDEEDDDDEETVQDPEVHGGSRYGAAGITNNTSRKEEGVAVRDGCNGGGFDYSSSFMSEKKEDADKVKVTVQKTYIIEKVPHRQPYTPTSSSPKEFEEIKHVDPTRDVVHFQAVPPPRSFNGGSIFLEEDPHAPKPLQNIDPSNYQTKTVDPSNEGGREANISPILTSFGQDTIVKNVATRERYPVESDSETSLPTSSISGGGGENEEHNQIPSSFIDSHDSVTSHASWEEVGITPFPSSVSYVFEAESSNEAPGRKVEETDEFTPSFDGSDVHDKVIPDQNFAENLHLFDEDGISPILRSLNEEKMKIYDNEEHISEDDFSMKNHQPVHQAYDSLVKDEPTDDFPLESAQNQSSYTEKISSATSALVGKAISAKNFVASKLGYSGEEGDDQEHNEPRDLPQGKGVAATVSGKLSPVLEKVAVVSSAVMSKVHGSSNTNGADTTDAELENVVNDKLEPPSDEDRALPESTGNREDFSDRLSDSDAAADREDFSDRLSDSDAAADREDIADRLSDSDTAGDRKFRAPPPAVASSTITGIEVVHSYVIRVEEKTGERKLQESGN